MSEPTARIQKIKKDAVRTRLIIFAALALSENTDTAAIAIRAANPKAIPLILFFISSSSVSSFF